MILSFVHVVVDGCFVNFRFDLIDFDIDMVAPVRDFRSYFTIRQTAFIYLGGAPVIPSPGATITAPYRANSRY